MFIQLSADFAAMGPIEWRDHEIMIDQLLTAHQAKRHLFCLRPNEIVKIKDAITLGPVNRDVLNVISQRSQDYLASARVATKVLVIYPIGSTSLPGPGREFGVAADQAGSWYQQEPALFVENAVNDGGIYAFLIKHGASAFRRSDAHISIKATHGGGTTLAQVLQLQGDRIQGMCVADRDCALSVPPFPSGRTARLSHEALCRMGLSRIDNIGVCERHPFFAFFSTAGWSLENYIGPSLLEAFFECNPSSCAGRPTFIDLFPNFPNLSNAEFSEWWTVNFKDAGQSSDDILNGLERLLGATRVDMARCRKLASLAMPQNAVQWVAQNARVGRHQRKCSAALLKDMRNQLYADAIEKLVNHSVVSLAADDKFMSGHV